MLNPLISLVNASTLVTDEELAAYVSALQFQVTRHLYPFWGVNCALSLVAKGHEPYANSWPIYVLDDDNGASGDLGYHIDDAGTPSAKIFATEDRKYGCSLSVTISHELLEMLVDPTANQLVGPYMLEVCDPVTSDAYAYTVQGVKVSDFVTPRYFFRANPANDPRFDFMGKLNAGAPHLLPGGYLESWNGSQWVQTRSRHPDGAHDYRSTRLGRSRYRVNHADNG